MLTGEKSITKLESQPVPTPASPAAVARPRWLAEDDPSPMQIEIYRAMSGQQRLKLAEALYWTARNLKTAGVRHHHPDWPEAKVTAEVNRIFLHARS